MQSGKPLGVTDHFSGVQLAIGYLGQDSCFNLQVFVYNANEPKNQIKYRLPLDICQWAGISAMPCFFCTPQ